MTDSEPNDAPPPRETGGVMAWPLIFNVALGLILYLQMTPDPRRGATEVAYFLMFGALVLANVVAAIVAAVLGKSHVAKGFLLMVLGIFLIGLGTCAYVLNFAG